MRLESTGDIPARIEGWSVAFRAGGGFRITDVSAAGTVSALAAVDPAGLVTNGSSVHELTEGDGNDGAWSGVILSLTGDVLLPKGVPSTVLRLTVEGSERSVATQGRLWFDETLTRQGHRIANSVVHDGRTFLPEFRDLEFDVRPREPFRRGDANLDGNFDISDGIEILRVLFLGGQTPECRDAHDADDNGRVQVTDAIASFSFLFLGGDPLPFPGSYRCDLDITPDELTCERTGPSC